MNNREFENKTAVVFAASRGIGRATALKLGAAGARVVVTYAGRADKAAEVVTEIEESGGKALAVQANVADAQQVTATFTEAERTFGGVDIVINAAGASVFGPMAQLGQVQLDTLIDINVRGAFNVLSEAARQVREGGSIVQFSTGGTKMPVPGGGAYADTKAAGEHMALGLAKELGGRDINVNVISPGVTNTDGLIMPDDQIQMLVGQTPLGRLGEAGDVADAVLFLVSDRAHWVTGQNLQANGGIL